MRRDVRRGRADSAARDDGLEPGVAVGAATAAARSENEPPAADPTATFDVTNACPTEHTLVASAANKSAARAIIIDELWRRGLAVRLARSWGSTCLEQLEIRCTGGP